MKMYLKHFETKMKGVCTTVCFDGSWFKFRERVIDVICKRSTNESKLKFNNKVNERIFVVPSRLVSSPQFILTHFIL